MAGSCPLHRRLPTVPPFRALYSPPLPAAPVARRDKWPKSIRCNGHLLLNSEKMSKSTGNFKTLNQAVHEYSADAMRIALADAGDGVDDANFEDTVANAAILRLTKELAWIEETLAAEGLRTGPAATFADRVFENAINVAVHRSRESFDRMMFREAIKHGMYDLQNSRDLYRLLCGTEGLNKDLVRRALLGFARPTPAPPCPHLLGQP